MGKKKQPKFKKGDTVVISMYGTVGNITDVKYLDGVFIYEVNHSEGLYLETTLQHIFEYEGEIHTEAEQIDIEYKFIFGDLVKVEGYEQDYFKVIGFRTEIWRYQEHAWEDVIYELSRISDGEWLETHEEEMELIADAEKAESFIKNMGMHASSPKKNVVLDPDALSKKPTITEGERRKNMEEKKQLIDGLLDLYNDYQILFTLFGDEDYKHVMSVAMVKIKKTASELYSNKKLAN